MAEAYFCKALEIAGQQKVKSLELRTAVSLARLWQGQGLSHEAFHLVAPVYDWFEEGGDTIDMTEARDLLDACGECRGGQGWIPRTAAS
jgi:predicted ATPase